MNAYEEFLSMGFIISEAVDIFSMEEFHISFNVSLENRRYRDEVNGQTSGPCPSLYIFDCILWWIFCSKYFGPQRTILYNGSIYLRVIYCFYFLEVFFSAVMIQGPYLSNGYIYSKAFLRWPFCQGLLFFQDYNARPSLIEDHAWIFWQEEHKFIHIWILE